MLISVSYSFELDPNTTESSIVLKGDASNGKKLRSDFERCLVGWLVS